MAFAVALLAACAAGSAGPSTTPAPTVTATPSAGEVAPATASPLPGLPGFQSWIWRASLDDWVWVRVSSGVVFASSGGLSLNAPGKVAAIDEVSGRELWTYNTPSQPFPVAVVEGRAVFGTAGGMVFAVDASSGKLAWQHDFPGVPFQVVSTDSSVIVADGDPEAWGGPGGIVDKTRLAGRVRALDPATGKQRWEATVRAFTAFVAAAGNDLIAASSSNQGSDDVALFEPDGSRRWLTTMGAISSPPVVANDSVIVAGSAMESLDLASGRVLWFMPPRNGGTYFGPTIQGEVVVAATNTHSLEARSLRIGSLSAMGQFPDCGFLPLQGSPYLLACGSLWRIDLSAQPLSMSPVLIPQGNIQSAAFADGQVFFSSSIGHAAPPIVSHIDPTQSRTP